MRDLKILSDIDFDKKLDSNLKIVILKKRAGA